MGAGRGQVAGAARSLHAGHRQRGKMVAPIRMTRVGATVGAVCVLDGASALCMPDCMGALWMAACGQPEQVRDSGQPALLTKNYTIPAILPVILTIWSGQRHGFVPPAGAIVTRLAAIEDMAGMNMLCSDKTGTLTLNKMVLQVGAVQPGIAVRQAAECNAGRLGGNGAALAWALRWGW